MILGGRQARIKKNGPFKACIQADLHCAKISSGTKLFQYRSHVSATIVFINRIGQEAHVPCGVDVLLAN